MGVLMTAPAGAPRDYAIAVTQHARERARQRFPGFKTARIIDEVRLALAAGRVSVTKPRPVVTVAPPKDDPTCIYVWTEDGDRIYALTVDRRDADRFAVTTTMRLAA